jgi:succinoglycan biosynthesis protein ExoA
MIQQSTLQVSIIVACRNESKHIRELIDGILAQDFDGIGWEVIVADGMSNDGTRDIINEYALSHCNVVVIDNPQQIVSTGLNAAIRCARGEVIIRMDAHTTYAPDYCRRSLALLHQKGAENVGGPARTCAKGTMAKAVAAAYHSRFSTGGAAFHRVDFEGWVDTVPYGCWSKSTLESLGLFDETLVRNQDDELNLRITRAGGKIWQSPSIVSWYSPRASLRKMFSQYFQYGFWKVAVIRKHKLPASWRHLVPVCWVGANIALLVAIIVALLTAPERQLIFALAMWVGMLATYLAATAVAAILTAREHGWSTLPYLPAVFATYHFSYGLGFAFGILKAVTSSAPSFYVTQDSAFTRISR